MQFSCFRPKKDDYEQKQFEKKVKFAICPACYWLVTYLHDEDKTCPRCGGKLKIQKVSVNAMELLAGKVE